MRSRSPLALMEQLIMLLVFALAAALCVQTFALSTHISQNAADRDRAMQLAQNAAEILKNHGGDMSSAQMNAVQHMGGQLSQGVWYILYDED